MMEPKRHQGWAHGQRSRATIALIGMLLAGCATWRGPHTRASAADRAATVALSMRGAPYRYGGTTPRGFDCSGLVVYSYRRAHVALPRTTHALSEVGRSVSRWHLHRGDLIFFYEAGRSYGHVGLYLGRNLFIHAPARGQRVRVDSLRSHYWSSHFSGARRLW